MASQSQCLLCCSCEPVAIRSPEAAGPFAIQHLLPAGTLVLPTSQPPNICDHTHSTEGWHTFPGKGLLHQLTDQETLCHHLDFLIENRFLTVQCKIADSGTALVLRIFIIPYDLPGVQGKLRLRNELSNLKPARLCLQDVLPRIVQDKCLWDAHDLDPSASSPHYFLDSKMVVIPFFSFCLKSH
jgi:hypothetical protein